METFNQEPRNWPKKSPLWFELPGAKANPLAPAKAFLAKPNNGIQMDQGFSNPGNTKFTRNRPFGPPNQEINALMDQPVGQMVNFQIHRKPARPNPWTGKSPPKFTLAIPALCFSGNHNPGFRIRGTVTDEYLYDNHGNLIRTHGK